VDIATCEIALERARRKLADARYFGDPEEPFYLLQVSDCVDALAKNTQAAKRSGPPRRLRLN
jgi:hypothetical protein